MEENFLNAVIVGFYYIQSFLAGTYWLYYTFGVKNNGIFYRLYYFYARICCVSGNTKA